MYFLLSTFTVILVEAQVPFHRLYLRETLFYWPKKTVCYERVKDNILSWCILIKATGLWNAFVWGLGKLEELRTHSKTFIWEKPQSQAPLGHLTLPQSPLGAAGVKSEKQKR